MVATAKDGDVGEGFGKGDVIRVQMERGAKGGQAGDSKKKSKGKAKAKGQKSASQTTLSFYKNGDRVGEVGLPGAPSNPNYVAAVQCYMGGAVRLL